MFSKSKKNQNAYTWRPKKEIKFKNVDEFKEKQRLMLHSMAHRIFYFHMKDNFVSFLASLPNDVAHMNINRKPSYNNYRGIWSHLKTELKSKYDQLAFNLAKVGICDKEVKQIGENPEFFTDFIKEV